jgi:hypothetical protein
MINQALLRYLHTLIITEILVGRLKMETEVRHAWPLNLHTRETWLPVSLCQTRQPAITLRPKTLTFVVSSKGARI